jgi:hypothetical protein
VDSCGRTCFIATNQGSSAERKRGLPGFRGSSIGVEGMGSGKSIPTSSPLICRRYVVTSLYHPNASSGPAHIKWRLFSHVLTRPCARERTHLLVLMLLRRTYVMKMVRVCGSKQAVRARGSTRIGDFKHPSGGIKGVAFHSHMATSIRTDVA